MIYKENKPLVSIIVITYNSKKTIIETLNSINLQTYDNLELIISDDYSSDNTVEICEKWTFNSKNRFKSIKIIDHKINTGVAQNCNRGINNSSGSWIKIIAGDDTLSNNCIERFMAAVLLNTKIKVIFSEVMINGVCNINKNKFFFNLSAEKQYEELLKRNMLQAPGSFISKKLLLEMKGFNNSYPMIEDYPFYLKVLENNNKIYGLDDYLVNYRVNHDGLSTSKDLNIKYYRDVRIFFQEYLIKKLIRKKMYMYAYHYFIEIIIIKIVELKIIRSRKKYDLYLMLLSPLKLYKIILNRYFKLLLCIKN